MPAVWYPLGRFTRSGREFSALSLSPFATPLQALDFNIAPLVIRAVAAEHDGQEDHEEEDASHDEKDAPHDDDALDEVGDGLPPDPLSEVDDVWPPPPPPAPGMRWTMTTPRLANAAAAATPPASTNRAHVERAVPLATGLTTSTLPAASGAYAAKAEDKGERYGSKVKRSLANVRGLGLQLVKWDGFTPRPLIDANGRIIAVLAGQPRNDAYRLAVERAFQTISDAA
ncbi:hypothetical protein B0H14DRAFT_3511848, partial [Mycena olivaceomarginata]